ncbi:MAG: acylphosphatase [Candidatus Omnitrophica bacterium]|nr:acylphosphatase [Candidatus Omnitrophota bacterium]
MVLAEKRVHVRFTGRVQGVGFRYTVASLSSTFDVAGYVRNDYDGSVELVAEGTERALIDFVTAIMHSGLERYITNHTIDWFPSKSEFTKFGIKY